MSNRPAATRIEASAAVAPSGMMSFISPPAAPDSVGYRRAALGADAPVGTGRIDGAPRESQFHRPCRDAIREQVDWARRVVAANPAIVNGAPDPGDRARAAGS